MLQGSVVCCCAVLRQVVLLLRLLTAFILEHAVAVAQEDGDGVAAGLKYAQAVCIQSNVLVELPTLACYSSTIAHCSPMRPPLPPSVMSKTVTRGSLLLSGPRARLLLLLSSDRGGCICTGGKVRKLKSSIVCAKTRPVVAS
jgi:hypothetical protein